MYWFEMCCDEMEATKWSVRKLFTLLCFFEFFEKMFKNTSNLCSNIQWNTTNPNTIFKITVYYTKYTKNAKKHSNFWCFCFGGGEIRKIKEIKLLFCILYKFHNSYFVFVVCFVLFKVFVFSYFFCRSLIYLYLYITLYID